MRAARSCRGGRRDGAAAIRAPRLTARRCVRCRCRPYMRTGCAFCRCRMGYDQAAPKRAVNMTLNEDLVRRARFITPNLSETVETLLAAYVDDAERRAAHRERQIAAHIAA